MKRFLIASVVTLIIVGFSLAIFFPNFVSIANKDFPYESDDPDLPGLHVLGGMEFSKEELMLRRAENIALMRGVENDESFDPTQRQEAIIELDRQQERLVNLPESEGSESLLAAWTPVGPAPIPLGQTDTTRVNVSGRTTAIAVHPTNPNLVYVGTAQGGLYRTTDGGTNWTALMDNAQSLAIGAIAIAPSQPETIYVGTGEPNFAVDAIFGVGVYRIDNASTTATLTGPLGTAEFNGRAIGEIVVHQTDPATIFVGSTSGVGGFFQSGASPSPLPARGLYRSINATSAVPTFTKLAVASPLPDNFNVRDIAIDPLNPNFLVVQVTVNNGGIYVSNNALAAVPAFTHPVTFAGANTNEFNAELSIYHVVGQPNPIVYVGTGNLGGRVLRSTDGGVTFPQRIDNNFCGGQCFYNIAIKAVPTNTNPDNDRVYIGGQTNPIFGISSDGGATFANSQANLHADTHVIEVAPSNSAIIYHGNDGGIFKSVNTGATWTPLNNSQFLATQFISLDVHPTDSNFSIGGTQDNGTNFRNGAGTWSHAEDGDGGYAVIDQNATNTTVVTMYHTFFNQTNAMGFGRVLTSATANPSGWTNFGCGFGGFVPNGMTCAATAILFYAPMERGPGNPNTLYFGSDVLYRSANSGTTMVKVSQEPITSGVPISAIGISPQNDGVRIVGLANGGIFGTGTTPGSTVLINLDPTNAVPNNFVARTVVHPTNQNTAYVTLTAYNVANVYKTTNLNTAAPTWTAVTGTGANVLPQIPVNGFLIDPLLPNNIYAGTDIGVYASQDGGANWMPFGTGLPRLAVFALKMAAGSMVTAATHGKGIYQIPALLAPTYEADVSARPNGDGSILSDDVVQIRRFLNGTHTADQTTDEFQRADSSPFVDRGDGRIFSDDVVQARRYQNGTNIKQLAAGPLTQAPPRPADAVDELFGGLSKTVVDSALLGNPREVKVENAMGSAGQNVTVNIRVNAVGNESEYGFIVNYDSTILSNPVVGAGTAGASVRSCNIATVGQVNCSVGGFPNNQPGSSEPGIGEIMAGTNQLLITVQFTIAANAQPGTTLLTLSNVNASSDAPQLLFPAATNGMVTILAPTAAPVSVSGRVTSIMGRGVGRARVIAMNANGEVFTALTSSFGYYRFSNLPSGETYIFTVTRKGYSFSNSTQVINLNEERNNVNFVADK